MQLSDDVLQGEQARTARAYYLISGLYTLAASLIWGVNTLFLLDAGLDILGVFVANSVWTGAMVLFEVPTGVLADTRGRRLSFLLSNAVLCVSTLAYIAIAEARAGLLAFCVVSALLGFGYTLYSGAVEAWVVDALRARGYQGSLDRLFAKGAVVSGAAMLVGTVGGGFLGTADLSLPFLIRAGLLVVTFVVALPIMHDVGFIPRPVTLGKLAAEMRRVGRDGVTWSIREPQIRLLVVASMIQMGFLTWGWYAWQPYFLELLQTNAVWVAGVIAAAASLATIGGNGLVEFFTRFCGKRTTMLIWASAISAIASIGVGIAPSFWFALAMFLVVMVSFGVVIPVKQAYLHSVVPSEHRATVVSFDSMVGNGGSIAGQTGLGALSREVSVGSGYVVGGAVTLLAIPAFLRLRRLSKPADWIMGRAAGKRGPCAGQGLPEISTVDTRPRVPEPVVAGAGPAAEGPLH
jgi:MFS family permease